MDTPRDAGGVYGPPVRDSHGGLFMDEPNELLQETAPSRPEEPAVTDETELAEEEYAPNETELTEAEYAVTEETEVTEGERVTNRTERVEEEYITRRTERVEEINRTERVKEERVTDKPEFAEEGHAESQGASAEAEGAAPSGEPEAPPTGGAEAEAPPTEAEKLSKKAKRAEKAVKEYQFAVLRVLVLLVVLWALFFKFIGLMRMPSDEMSPRIDAGDIVLYYRLDTDVRAQDVIVLSKAAPEWTEPRPYVLRVVAAPGDTVDISDGDRLIVNGNTVAEPNIFYPTPRYEGFVDYPLTLGEDECFVLADARNRGADSRYFGPVRRDEILGTAITILRRNNL